ncbi:methyl-accepting chemotaxis protein [Vibrio sinaloensis DSM 21326]|uniref:Methyl-accepting chemotaxis protein n=1 Tax=Vibrio sinaloensis DSM 21326 TaxID=945550 RepID=E8M8N2_PHOS4|nr:hypothetical protein [Vibrio sinaloensis]EGA69577.1 methyl-accepting chemotaxis protein [Vibrio sinaloensis DSM 21326]
MGGKSSSKNSTTTTNVSGQNAISGDNLGTAISGVNNSTINVTATDYGAVEESFALGQQAIEQTTDFANQALEEFSSSNSENLQMLAGLAGNQAAQNTKNLETLQALAKFKQDGGANESNRMNMYVMLAIAVILGFVTYKAVSR